MYTYNTPEEAIEQLTFAHKNNDKTPTKKGFNNLLKAIETIKGNKAIRLILHAYLFIDDYNILA